MRERYDRYDVIYEGSLFVDETPIGKKAEFNSVSFNSWADANELYVWCEAQGIDVELRDNEYGVSLYKGEWR